MMTVKIREQNIYLSNPGWTKNKIKQLIHCFELHNEESLQMLKFMVFSHQEQYIEQIWKMCFSQEDFFKYFKVEEEVIVERVKEYFEND